MATAPADEYSACPRSVLSLGPWLSASVRSPFAFEVDRNLCVRTRARARECVRNKVGEEKKKERKRARERDVRKHEDGGGVGG